MPRYFPENWVRLPREKPTPWSSEIQAGNTSVRCKLGWPVRENGQFYSFRLRTTFDDSSGTLILMYFTHVPPTWWDFDRRFELIRDYINHHMEMRRAESEDAQIRRIYKHPERLFPWTPTQLGYARWWAARLIAFDSYFRLFGKEAM